MKATILREKLETLTQEMELLKTSYVTIIQSKESEIEICKNLVSNQETMHQEELNTLKNEMQKLKQDFIAIQKQEPRVPTAHSSHRR